jgi:hypothetical protein
VSRLAEVRGSVAALGVGLAVVVLYVALQPGPAPVREAAPTTTTEAPDATVPTTRPAPEVICELARWFADAASPDDPNHNARLGETFYEESRLLVTGALRAEFEAAAQYFAEYNAIGEPHDYDLFRIIGAGDGDRWTQLILRPPLGVEEVRASVRFACDIDLPPPPTITTTTTTTTTTLPPTTAPPTSAAAPSTTASPTTSAPPPGDDDRRGRPR